MKKYKKQICLIAAVCLLGTAAFCGYHIYNHYADEAEQTEAFENIAEIVEQAQAEDGNAPEVPLTEEENILTEYGELYLKNTDMVGWLSIAGTTGTPSFSVIRTLAGLLPKPKKPLFGSSKTSMSTSSFILPRRTRPERTASSIVFPVVSMVLMLLIVLLFS